MGVSGQRHAPAALYPRRKDPGTHWIGGWVGLRAGLDAGARRKILCPCRRSNLDHPIVQPVVRHYTAWTTAPPRHRTYVVKYFRLVFFNKESHCGEFVLEFLFILYKIFKCGLKTQDFPHFLGSKKLLEREGDINFLQFTEHIDQQNSGFDYPFQDFKYFESQMVLFNNSLKYGM
jgi:hypothetical protein